VLFIAVQSQRAKCSVVQVSLFKNVQGWLRQFSWFCGYSFAISGMANFRLRTSALARMSPYASADREATSRWRAK
jgi:hypothetical protein